MGPLQRRADSSSCGPSFSCSTSEPSPYWPVFRCRTKGADHRRVSRERRELEDRAARPEAAGHARARGRRRGRCPRVLDGRTRRMAEDARAAGLVPQAMYSETREQARKAITRFAGEDGAKYPKAVTTLEKDANALLTFFDFPAEHWKHLRICERDRVAVRDGPAAAARDEGRGLTDEGAADGLQAPRHDAGPLAAARRRAP